jgi:ribonuclease HII
MKDEIVHDAGDDTVETPIVSESNAEVETLRMENETLRSEIRTSKARAALTTELTVAGARSPELLIAAAEKDIQFDDDNTPVNVASVIAKLTQHYPEQFGPEKPASIDAGAGRLNQNNFLTREALAKMKPQEIARLDWNEVRSVLSN